MTSEPRYDVALSFAGEERQYVDAVAAHLKNASVKVFYDDYEKVQLWGKDLYLHLDWVYRKASRYCVVFVSEDYARKVWTNHERRSAQPEPSKKTRSICSLRDLTKRNCRACRQRLATLTPLM